MVNQPVDLLFGQFGDVFHQLKNTFHNLEPNWVEIQLRCMQVSRVEADTIETGIALSFIVGLVTRRYAGWGWKNERKSVRPRGYMGKPRGSGDTR